MLILYMCVCAWCVYLTSGHEQEPESALRRDRWFSHMGNSVWLHWGARKYLNKQCTVHWAKWCALSMISHSAMELAAAVYVVLIENPQESLVDTFLIITLLVGPRVVWSEGGVCCDACQTWWYFLWHSHLWVLWRAAFEMAQLGLGQWQWRREAVNLWHTAVTNCEEKVREICSEAVLKDMVLSACFPWVWLSKNEILESWILWRGAAIYCSLLVFMEVILVVSGRELMF